MNSFKRLFLYALLFRLSICSPQEYPLGTSCQPFEKASNITKCTVFLTGQIGGSFLVNFTVDLGFNNMIVNTDPSKGGVACHIINGDSLWALYSDYPCIVNSDEGSTIRYGKNHSLMTYQGIYEEFDMDSSLLPFNITALASKGNITGNIYSSIGIGINSTFVLQLPSKNISSLFINPVIVPNKLDGSTFMIGGWNKDHLRNENSQLALFNIGSTTNSKPIINDAMPSISISKILINGFTFYYSRQGDRLRFSTMDDGIFIPSPVFKYFMDFWEHQRCGQVVQSAKQNCTFQAQYAPNISFELVDVDGQHHIYEFTYIQYVNQLQYVPMIHDSKDSFWGTADDYVLGLGPLSKLLLVIDHENLVMGIAESKGADFHYPGRGDNVVFSFFVIFLGLPVIVWGIFGLYAIVMTKCLKRKNPQVIEVFASALQGPSKTKSQKYASLIKSLNNVDDFQNFPFASTSQKKTDSIEEYKE